MAARNHSDNHALHGNALEWRRLVLLFVDVLHDLDLPDSAVQAASVLARNISAPKKQRCEDSATHRDKWRADFSAAANCLRAGAPGRQMVERLVPESFDYIVLKSKHSASYATRLDELLSYLKPRR